MLSFDFCSTSFQYGHPLSSSSFHIAYYQMLFFISIRYHSPQPPQSTFTKFTYYHNSILRKQLSYLGFGSYFSLSFLRLFVARLLFFRACCSVMCVACLVSTIAYACVDIFTIPNGNAYCIELRLFWLSEPPPPLFDLFYYNTTTTEMSFIATAHRLFFFFFFL